MSNEKIKLYKNAARSRDENSVRQQYIPQYQSMGLTPTKQVEIKAIPGNVLIARTGSSEDNPRLRRPAISQPYAAPSEIIESPLGNKPIPNVGNNMEQTWSYVDTEMIDDISGEVVGKLEDNAIMIDNNDIIELPGEAMPQDEPTKHFMTENDLKAVINNNLSALQDDSYILIVNGTILSVGLMEDIQEEASALIFGEHELCDGQTIPIENIVVLKKIKVKVGLFLE